MIHFRPSSWPAQLFKKDLANGSFALWYVFSQGIRREGWKAKEGSALRSVCSVTIEAANIIDFKGQPNVHNGRQLLTVHWQ